MTSLPALPRRHATLEEFLGSLGLVAYVRAFRDNHVDLGLLPMLDDGDLREIGIASLGHRRRLLQAVRAAFAPAMPVAPAAPRPTAPRKRQVTVLFADLTGYTRLVETLPAEHVLELLQDFYGIVDPVVEAHGGRVENHMGDCTLAVFGMEGSDGHDSARAVRAAQEIRARLEAFRCRRGERLGVHIGVASGPVVIGQCRPGEPGSMLTGRALNLASRLADAARDGEVLISDGVRRALGRGVACRRRGGLELKGIEGPVEAWAVGAPGDGDPEPTFVGREAELGRVARAWAEVRRGSGRVLCLSGPAGIGKTRLVEAFLERRVGPGVAVHRVDCAPGSDRVARLAGRGDAPGIVVVEDLHRADRSGIEAAKALMRIARERAMLVLLTTRAGIAAGTGDVPTLRLGGLAPEDAAALARELAEAPRPPPSALGRAMGNPLVLRHLVRDPRGGVPGAVEALFQAELDLLGAADRAVLEAASVLGERVAAEALRQAAGDPGPLLAAGWLAAEGAELRFARPMLRGSVLGLLTGARRAELADAVRSAGATDDAPEERPAGPDPAPVRMPASLAARLIPAEGALRAA